MVFLLPKTSNKISLWKAYTNTSFLAVHGYVYQPRNYQVQICASLTEYDPCIIELNTIYVINIYVMKKV